MMDYYKDPVIYQGIKYWWACARTLSGYGDEIFYFYESEVGRNQVAIDSSTKTIHKVHYMKNEDGVTLIGLSELEGE